MPYKTKGSRLVNEVTLGDGYPLSSNLKPLKVGGKTSPLEMSAPYPDDSVKARVKVNGNLEILNDIKINGTVTAPNSSINKFQVQGQYEVYGIYGSLNTWYTGNQSFGTSITEGDWGGGTKYNYAQFTAVNDVKLLGWKFHGSFSSAVDWEMEVWHTETPADGESDPEEATKVGDTQSITPTATRLYTLGQTGLSYSIPAGDQLYLLTRFASGSGTKYSYGTVGFEFSY